MANGRNKQSSLATGGLGRLSKGVGESSVNGEKRHVPSLECWEGQRKVFRQLISFRYQRLNSC